MKKCIYVMDDATPDGLSNRANLMVHKGWVVKYVECHPSRWWFGKDKWVAVLTKDVHPKVTLPITVGPVTQRS